mgnify:CR=1 FL=1
MGLTKIEWCDYTFNPWWGCTKISPGCLNCYAESMGKRWGFDCWGKGVPRRRFTTAQNWDEPLRWNREAAKLDRRPRVFCGSMCDLFDEDRPDEDFERLIKLTKMTPQVDWLWLTKRPERLSELERWHMANVWIGVSVENAEHWERVDTMFTEAFRYHRAKPVRFAKFFVSLEPMLEPIPSCSPQLDWIIIGGESGCKARRFDIEWCERYIALARTCSVPVFVKQIGSRPYYRGEPYTRFGAKGEQIETWPESIRVREEPR